MSYKTIAANYRRAIKECIVAGDVMAAAEYEDMLRELDFNLWAATR